MSDEKATPSNEQTSPLRARIRDALPSTDLSDDVEVARIVLSLDGDVASEPLTETWAPVFVCMERYGKVRTFLRAHGWLPMPEREPGLRV